MSTPFLIPLRFFRDWRLCWRLANDPTERAMARDLRRPTVWRHTRWMFTQRFSPRRFAWTVNGGAGIVRVERFGECETEVHISLLPEYRGVGIGTAALRAVVGFGRPPVVAYVKPTNTASLRAFQKAGFVVTGETPSLVRLRYEARK